MNYYQILGVDETASQDEIKRAYRKLAAINHPDRGGDTSKFQEISQAYDTLGDPDKRSIYDAQRNASNGFGGGTSFHFTGGNFGDIFNEVFKRNSFGDHFAQGNPQPRRKNRDLVLRVRISLEQSFNGTELEASYQTPNKKTETVSIKIPQGIHSGQTIQYPGLGDNSDPTLPRGDLNVTVLVDRNPRFERNGDDLVTYLEISPIEAMIGCSKTVVSLNGISYNINTIPGCKHGTPFIIPDAGFKSLHGKQGNLVAIATIIVPSITDPVLKEQLEKINQELTK